MILDKKYKVKKAVAKAHTNPAFLHCFMKGKYLYGTNGRMLVKIPIIPEVGDTDGFVTVDAIQHGRNKNDKGRSAVLLYETFQTARNAKFDRPSQKDLKWPNCDQLIEQVMESGKTLAQFTIDAGELYALSQALGDSKVMITVRQGSNSLEVHPYEKSESKGILALADVSEEI